VAKPSQATFDPKTFPATVGRGRTLVHQTRGAVVYRQSAPAEVKEEAQRGVIDLPRTGLSPPAALM
jgi:hypothetical protein